MAFAGFSLEGQRALVAGGSAGLGFAIAAGLAEAGAAVVVNGRDGARCADAAARIGGLARAEAGDIADAAALDRLFAAEPYDIVVNAVGVRDRRDLFAFELSDVEAHLRVNLVAAFELSRRAARGMIARGGGGRILHVASIAGAGGIARSGDAAYTMAKAGVGGLVRALAAELGAHAITVNALAPGYFATERNAEMTRDAAIADWLSQRTSLGRWGQPEEIAGAAVFLASPAARYVTGVVLPVDGGYLAHF